MSYVIKETRTLTIVDTDFDPNKINFKECNLTTLGIMSEITKYLTSKDPEFFPLEIHYPKYSAEYIEKALDTLLGVYEKEKDK